MIAVFVDHRHHIHELSDALTKARVDMVKRKTYHAMLQFQQAKTKQDTVVAQQRAQFYLIHGDKS